MATACEERHVQVMHMKSPSVFWVRNSESEDMTETYVQVHKGEQSLNKLYNRSKQYTKIGSYLPNEGELVAIQHPNTKLWHRAKVDYVLETASGFQYHVFLVDHGYPMKKIRSAAIRQLPKDFIGIGFLAVEVVLKDVVPLTITMDYKECKMESEITDTWPVAAWSFVKKLLGHSRNAVLKISGVVNEVIIGDLLLDGVSISEKLCTEKYATCSAEHFQKGFEALQTGKLNCFNYLEFITGAPAQSDSRDDKVTQKYLVDYAEDEAEREKKQKLQQLKENAASVMIEDCDMPSVGRGVKRIKKESPFGASGESNQSERKRVSGIGRGSCALELLHYLPGSSENENVIHSSPASSSCATVQLSPALQRQFQSISNESEQANVLQSENCNIHGTNVANSKESKKSPQKPAGPSCQQRENTSSGGSNQNERKRVSGIGRGSRALELLHYLTDSSESENVIHSSPASSSCATEQLSPALQRQFQSISNESEQAKVLQSENCNIHGMAHSPQKPAGPSCQQRENISSGGSNQNERKRVSGIGRGSRALELLHYLTDSSQSENVIHSAPASSSCATEQFSPALQRQFQSISNESEQAKVLQSENCNIHGMAHSPQKPAGPSCQQRENISSGGSNQNERKRVSGIGRGSRALELLHYLTDSSQSENVIHSAPASSSCATEQLSPALQRQFQSISNESEQAKVLQSGNCNIHGMAHGPQKPAGPSCQQRENTSSGGSDQNERKRVSGIGRGSRALELLNYLTDSSESESVIHSSPASSSCATEQFSPALQRQFQSISNESEQAKVLQSENCNIHVTNVVDSKESKKNPQKPAGPSCQQIENTSSEAAKGNMEEKPPEKEMPSGKILCGLLQALSKIKQETSCDHKIERSADCESLHESSIKSKWEASNSNDDMKNMSNKINCKTSDSSDDMKKMSSDKWSSKNKYETSVNYNDEKKTSNGNKAFVGSSNKTQWKTSGSCSDIRKKSYGNKSFADSSVDKSLHDGSNKHSRNEQKTAKNNCDITESIGTDSFRDTSDRNLKKYCIATNASQEESNLYEAASVQDGLSIESADSKEREELSVKSSITCALLLKAFGKGKCTKESSCSEKVTQSHEQLKVDSGKKFVKENQKTNAGFGELPSRTRTMKELLNDEALTSRILVHGDVRLKPIQYVAEANFPSSIHQALGKMGFKVPYRIQKYAWPAILRGQNAILVGPQSSGKTFSCLVPLLSFMTQQDTYSELSVGNGPYVLILCAGCKSAQETYDMCMAVLSLAGHKNITVLVAYGGGPELELKEHFINGCDILISTPKCFLRLIRYSKYMMNLNRLVHLMLDEVDILASKYLYEVKEIISECKSMLKQRAKLQIPVQVLAASEEWTPAVEQFARHISQNFLICISGYLEAAVYAKLQPKLYFLKKGTKASTLLSIVEESQGMFKVVVMCHYIDDVEQVKHFFNSQTHEVLYAHENVTHRMVTDIKQQWKSSTVPGCHPILVCTDGVLPDLEIYDAMWLIHYNLPRTKTAFGFRFSCLMDNYRNMFSCIKDDKPYCSVHILLDKDEDTKELPEVLRFASRLGVSVDSTIKARAEKVREEKELSKSGVPLCYNLKAFGYCWGETSNCTSRHCIIKDKDSPNNIPASGEVTIRVLKVIDASRFTARIVQHKDHNSNTKAFPNEYFAVTSEVLRFYGNKKNRIPHEYPKLGDVCAVEVQLNQFHRAKVIQIIAVDKSNIPKEVKIHMLDEGTNQIVKVSQLLELPEKLKEPHPQVVEVFLCNIMPCDKDWYWSEMASCRMANWITAITEKEEEGKYLKGLIRLSLGNTLWLDPLECCSYLENASTWVKDSNLSKDLIAVKLAVKNPNHLTKLYALSKAGGINLPITSEKQQSTAPVHQPLRKAAPKQPQWAYLAKEEYQQILFVYADNPHRFFVRLLKFQDSLQRLMAELQQNADDPKKFCAERGVCCIAKFSEDGKWNRAKVLDVLPDGKIKVFYVDHGDTAIVDIDHIASIREKYITKLPFQIIECSLIGVKPVENGEWSEEATDALYDFGEHTEHLFTKVCETEQTASCTGGKLYRVVLIDTSTTVDLILNRTLVEQGLALPVESEVKAYHNVLKTNMEALHSTADNENENSNYSQEQSTSLPDFDIENCDVAIDNVKELGNFFKMFEPVLSLPSASEKQKQQQPCEAQKSSIDAAHNTCSSDSYLSTDERDQNRLPPPLLSRTKIPCVNWYQDDCFVYLKIMLTGIQEYNLTWDARSLDFCAEIIQQIYRLSIEFYSGIEPEELVHVPKGLYLQVTLRKIMKGFRWPRLLLTEGKYHWIKKDLEMFKEESECEEETAISLCRKAMKALSENSNLTSRSERKSGEHIVPDALAVTSDSEQESDTWEPAEETIDCYDPLG